jgi:hypothetical protein
LEVYSFEVFVSDRIEAGEYSLRMLSDNRLIGQMPGVITIDEQRNPLYSTIF